MSTTRCVLQAVAVLIAAIGPTSARTSSLTGTLRVPQDSVTLPRAYPGDVAEDIASLITVTPEPGVFGLSSLGLMCAVCLSFRRNSPPANGPPPRIDSTEDYQDREAFSPVEASIRQMKRSYPDAVLMEIGFHGMSGVDGIRMLKSVCPQAEILVLAETPAPVAWQVREVHGGGPTSPEAPRRVIALVRKVRPSETPGYGLTAQETRVLCLLGAGHHYKTAAADLGVTLNTLSFHVRRLYDKLQVHSKAEAVAKALRDGILR